MAEQEKRVLIVSNNGAGIRKVAEKNGFKVVSVVPHREWVRHIGTMEACFLVILDEVDQFIGGNIDLDDEEERVLLGEEGPFVLVLVRDDDFRLDARAETHRRWRVHHIQSCLGMCLAELYLAQPQRHSWHLHLYSA